MKFRSGAAIEHGCPLPGTCPAANSVRRFAAATLGFVSLLCSKPRKQTSPQHSDDVQQLLSWGNGNLHIDGVGMRFQRWVSWLAVAAILLHAATVAHHNVIQFQAIPAGLASLAILDPGIICHADSEADEGGKAHTLPRKSPGPAPKPCPVCLGLASAHALPASEGPSLRVPQTVLAAAFVRPGLVLAPAVRLSLPLTRGPPALG